MEHALWACLRAYPARPAATVDCGQPGFWTLANEHGVAALVGAQMGGSVPGQRARRMQLAHSICVIDVLRRVLDICRTEAIRVVCLKGPILAARLYADYALRPTSDVDVLVAERDLVRTVNLLELHGGRLGAPYVENRASHERFNHHLGVAFRGTLVEVHMRASLRFGGRILAEPLLGRARSERVLDFDVLTLEPHDELIYLAVHAATHFFGRDILLLDLRRLTEQRRIDWSLLEARAREFRVRRVVAASLCTAHRRVGLDISKMPLGWRRLGEDRLRLKLWQLGVFNVSTDSEALQNMLVDAAWADTLRIGARYVGERVWFGMRRRLAGHPSRKGKHDP